MTDSNKAAEKLHIGNIIAELQQFYTSKFPLKGVGYPKRLIMAYVDQQSESDRKEIERLKSALMYARNMLIGYDMRHPNERQIMLSTSNEDVFLLIEQALTSAPSQENNKL